MQGLQIHSAEQSRAFFARPSKLAFVRFEPIKNPDGTFRKGWDLLFYCPERDQVFLVLDYQKYPYEIPPYSLPERPGLTQSEGLPFSVPMEGERLIPALWHYTAVVHHLKRYRFAREHLKPGSALDCACGAGYGTHMMLHRGDVTRAVGVDISEFAVDFSRRLVKDPRARFSTKLPDETFDNIVCLETLEHPPDPYEFMRELIRRLAPGGQVILSVPEERFFGSSLGPFHVSHWNLARLENFLSSFFGDIHIHYQRACGMGPDTFSASAIGPESWGANRNEWLLAILKGPEIRPKKRIVVRRTSGLREALAAGPVVEQVKAENPEKDVVVVTEKIEAFFGNPHADMVMTPAWRGQVDIDLDAAGESDRPRELQRRARLYPSEDEVNFAEGIRAADGKKIIACHPMAAPSENAWPERCWMELIARLRSEYSVVVLGGAGDYIFNMPGVRSFVGVGLPLTCVAAILAKSELLVCPQGSELTHVAAVMETPAVVLPACACGTSDGKRMEAITVEMVLKTVGEALSQRGLQRPAGGDTC